MTFRQFAFNNIIRNKRLYAAYFLSSMFTVMVFFTFANFAFHPTLTGENTNVDVMQGMLVASGIIYVFSFFFILYSMSQFLQSRKKEFGLLLTQGMSNRQIRWMVFLENMLVGFFSTVTGIGLGFAFSKVILLIAENVLVIDEHLTFYMPTKALLLTFISFVMLFALISIFVAFILRTSKLITLVKGDEMGKDEPKASIVLTILSALLLGSGYWIALTVEGLQVVIALFPVVLLVTVGTYLFFTQLSVFLIRLIKRNKNFFWKRTNMLLFADLSHRMKDNARAFFMVAIISTVAFSAIGTLIGLNSYLLKEMKLANPISFVYFGEDEEFSVQVEETIKENNLTVDHAAIELNSYEQGDTTVLITTAKTYNAFANLIGEESIEIPNSKVAVVDQSARNLLMQQIELEELSVRLEDGTEVPVDPELIGVAQPDILPEIGYFFIVGEDIYTKLGTPEYTSPINAWQVVEGKEEDILAVGEALETQEHDFAAIDWLLHGVKAVWGPIMFVGLFIGIVFFVSAGSFLYFRLYTDLNDDRTKFAAINKIGLTTKEMSQVISRQVGILFFAPMIVALVHGAVALTALSNLFTYNLVYESSLVLGSFLMIQIIYFVIVRYLYVRQIRAVVY